MTRNEFKAFCNTIAKADAEHDIWWCGQYFLDLTQAQYKKVFNLICQKPFMREGVAPNGKPVVILPSGLGLGKVVSK